jgi:hypothetical protein
VLVRGECVKDRQQTLAVKLLDFPVIKCNGSIPALLQKKRAALKNQVEYRSVQLTGNRPFPRWARDRFFLNVTGKEAQINQRF